MCSWLCGFLEVYGRFFMMLACMLCILQVSLGVLHVYCIAMIVLVYWLDVCLCMESGLMNMAWFLLVGDG